MFKDSPDNPMRLAIKKYPNRRFYDTTRSCHITLEQIFQAVRAGHEVQVTDSKRGHDITARVLAQIILEMDTFKLDTFPTNLLHQVIRSNDTLVQEFVEAHFSEAFEWFGQTKRLMEEQFRCTVGLTDESRRQAQPPDRKMPDDTVEETEDLAGLTGRLDRLTDQLANVRERLAAAKPART